MGYLDDYADHAANELEDIMQPYKREKTITNPPIKKLDTMNVIHLTPQLWQTEQINELATALIAFQSEFDTVGIKKDAKNPHLKNTYVSLDNLINTTRNILVTNDLVITQEMAGDYLVTTLIHSSGQFKGSAMNFNPMAGNKGTNVLQEIGGGITYAKRYAWAALLGISVDTDDDAHSMKGKKVAAPKKKPYPVANYDKGAKSIYDGVATLDDIRKVFTVSKAAEKVLQDKVYKLANNTVKEIEGHNTQEHTNKFPTQ